jgi:hypothetical protein
MPTIINPLITDEGLSAAISAAGNGLQLAITHVALGSGQYTPLVGMTAMTNRKEKVTIPSGYVTGGGGFRINALFPSWAGTPNPYNATEVGFYAGDPDAGGVLFAVYSHTSNVIVQRNSLDYVCQFSMVLTRVPAGSVTVTIDASAAQAMALVAAHEGGVDPHPQYALKADMNALISAGLAANDYKQSVRAATTVDVPNIASAAPSVLDGVTLALNDRILVKDQATASQNGFYIVAVLGTGANGTWTRSTDADAAGELTSGALVAVESGTINADSQWILTTDGVITIGTTALTFASVRQTSGKTRIQESKSSDYTLAMVDSDKKLFHPTSDTAMRTLTIPSNASVPYDVGTEIPILNQFGAGELLLTIQSDTLRLAGTNYSGIAIIPANSMGVIHKVTPTEWMAYGAGWLGGVFIFNDTVSTTVLDYNLRAKAVAAGWDQTQRLIATVTLTGTGKMGSTASGIAGFDTGIGFPNGATIRLNTAVGSYIAGKGGDALYTSQWNAPGPGVAGATGLRAQVAITVDNLGTIQGGGGGGGQAGTTAPDGIGGGGAPGAGLNVGIAFGGASGGTNSTLLAAGTSGGGGAGGAPGLPGTTGVTNSNQGGGGGAGGKSVEGNSLITWIGLGVRTGVIA